MKQTNLSQLNLPATHDPLMEVLRSGAKRMLAAALEAEVDQYCEFYGKRVDEKGRRLITRNGFAPEREIQTGLGPIEVTRPKVRFRGDGEQKPVVPFSSNIVPAYLKRTKNIEELIPWLYLRGISSGDFSSSLQALLGTGAKGLSAATVGRLKQVWEQEYDSWAQRSFEGRRYIYMWADGVHFKVRLSGEKQCILVLIGVTEEGVKELVAVEDGVRESEISWTGVLASLRDRGLEPPKLAVGDGALGFWKALNKVFPETKEQRCWIHKANNILNKLPKSVHAQARVALAEISTAPNRKTALKAADRFETVFGSKYPKATACLNSSLTELVTFFDFPADHWKSIRTTNPIESAFATVRLRTKRTKGSGSAQACLVMVLKLMQCAEKNWNKLRGYRLLVDVKNDVVFVDGVRKVA